MGKYVKPTLDTRFHIDFSWWNTRGQNLRTYLSGHACPECRERHQQDELFDWIDPESGEVYQLDIIWHCITTYCGQQPDFIDSQMPLASAIFRMFIVNNNIPLTPVEMYEKLQKKSPDLILRTIGGGRQVYHGIRPIAVSL